jgi:spiro-SPASM protein
MSRVAVILSYNCNAYIEKKFSIGKDAARLCRQFTESLQGIDAVFVIADEASFECAKRLKYPTRQIKNQLALILRELNKIAKSYENIVLYGINMPLLQIELAEELLRVHEKYLADYSFSDGYPHGIVPEIVSSKVVEAITKLAEGNTNPYSNEGLFELVQKDINSFDIETLLPEKDYRMMRLELAVHNISTWESVDILLKNEFEGYKDLLSFAETHPEVHRTRPTIYSIQISAKCHQKCRYCPYPLINPNLLEDTSVMSLSDFKTILDKIQSFTPEALVSLGLWGEPSTNPDVYKMIEYSLLSESLSVLIETSGLGWDQKELKLVFQRELPQKPTFIVSLDSDDPATYRKLRGYGYDEAVELIQFLKGYISGNIYAQAVRMEDNEIFLLDFLASWEKVEGVTPLIQKYDTFCGVLEDRRLTDISPLDRMPCWHILRDMYILHDGTVPLCKEDIHITKKMGNILTDTVETIWGHGREVCKSHFDKNYPALCKSCDEYYTFNF